MNRYNPKAVAKLLLKPGDEIPNKNELMLIGVHVTREFVKELDAYRVRHNFTNRGKFLRYVLEKELNSGQGENES